jgi:hypothetical protein
VICSTGSRLNLKRCLAPCGCLKTRSIRFGKVGIWCRFSNIACASAYLHK